MRLHPKGAVGHVKPEREDIPTVNAGEERLTLKQRAAMALLRGAQRHTALVGGSRSGKTVGVVRVLVVRALRSAGSRHAILRLNSNAVWPSIGLDTFPWVMANLFQGIKYTEHRRDGYFEFANGAQIWLGGLDDKDRVDKILGREYASIFWNECSQISYQSVVTSQSRLAQNAAGLKQRAYYDLNPVGLGHWTNLLFGEHKDPITRKLLPDPENYKRIFLNPIDNLTNLSAEYLESLKNMPIRQRKRFYEGLYVDETENALWNFDMIERGRIDPALQKLPDMQRIVVAIDPSGARNQFDTQRDAIGIVVCGLGSDGHGYVLEDLTRLDSPKGWARVAIGAYYKWHADCIVAEVNFGGAMVENTIHVEDATIPYKEVTASRGKVIRAEPVSALYGDPYDPLRPTKIHHVGRFLLLEEQMTQMSDLGFTGAGSPNNCDAMVWGISELMLGENMQAWLDFLRQDLATAQGVELPKSKTQPLRTQMLAEQPHQTFMPHKERRYMSGADCRIHQMTSAGIIAGALPDDVVALQASGCRAYGDGVSDI